MDRQKIIRRLRYLRNGEAFNILFQPLCLWWVLHVLEVPVTWPYVYGMGAVCFILAQGALYWSMKLKAVKSGGHALPPAFGPLFRAFQRLDLGILGLYPALALMTTLVGVTRVRDVLWAILLWAFALAEYVNYYHVQLMYDTPSDLRYLLRERRLRRSHLAEDMTLASARQG